MLSALLLDRTSWTRVNGLEPRHFYSNPNQYIFRAARDLMLAGMETDPVSVAGALRDRGDMPAVGGSPYLAQLLDATPSVAHIEQHAARITECWRRRELSALCTMVAAKAEAGEPLTELLQELEQLKAVPQADLRSETTTERLRLLADSGPRIRTGISCVDDLCRGGIRSGKLVGIGGGPHCGKTTLCAQVADNMVRDGVAVGFIAYDESSDGIDSRILQAHGCTRIETEEPTDHTYEVSAELDLWPLHIFEPCNIEDAIEQMAKLYPDKERVIFIDSIQRAHTSRSRFIPNKREAVDEMLETLKSCSRNRVTRCLVIFTSELNRGAYRNRDQSENIDPMAAGKESGAIEYHCDVWAVLTWNSGEQGRVTLQVPKNRVGKRTQPDKSLELQLDVKSCQFVFLGEDAQEELRERAHAVALERACKAIMQAVDREPGLCTRDLRQAAKGDKSLLPAAMRSLQRAGLLANKGNDKKACWFRNLPAEESKP